MIARILAILTIAVSAFATGYYLLGPPALEWIDGPPGHGITGPG